MRCPQRPLFITSIHYSLILLVALAVLTLPVLAGGADRLSEHPALQPFDVSGKKLPPNLFLVRTPKDLPEDAGLVVLGKRGSVALVTGDPEVVGNLRKKGCAVLPVENWERIEPVAREWVPVGTPDPDIAALVAQVQWPDILDKIEWLVDFGTRYSYAPNHADVVEALRSRFSNLGLQVALKPFQWEGHTMWTVEATQVGTRFPDSYVVICGHFDSLSEHPMVSAPGADDNGTGTAMVLTAAEILSQHTFDYSIRYICFAGEELGLIGSFIYTAGVRQQNLDIVGTMNFDMIGWWEPGVEKELEIETDQASLWLAHAITNAADLYTDAEYELHVYDWAWWGDHYPFWLFGYSAVNHEESWDWYDPDFNPNYHSTQDLPQFVDPDYTTENVKVGIASLATLANAGPVIEVSFDMKPGSCPNPFNPKSNGVVTAAIFGSPEFDVTRISIGTLRIDGVVVPVKGRAGDVGSYTDANGNPCVDTTPDGFLDLSLKFEAADIAAAIGPVAKHDAVTLRLTGRLLDGTAFEGEEIVNVVGNTGGPLLAGTVVPDNFALHQNVPNPFNPTTTIRYDVPAPGGHVNIAVYDVQGKRVRTLFDGPQVAGAHSVPWGGESDSGARVASGLYFVQMKGQGFVRTRKMVLLK